MKIGITEAEKCAKELKIQPLSEADFLFLNSFLKLMKIIVRAMDFLQQEKDCYMGHLIPTIMGIQKKLEESTDKAMEPLKKALLDGLVARFSSVLHDQDYIIATMLLPQFRLSCVSEERRLECRQLVHDYVLRVQREVGDLHVSTFRSTESSQHIMMMTIYFHFSSQVTLVIKLVTVILCLMKFLVILFPEIHQSNV